MKKNGTLSRQEDRVEGQADTRSDLRLENVLQRRGVALDMSGLMEWKVHELLVARLFQAPEKSPPEGFNSVTLDHKKYFQDLQRSQRRT